MGYFFVLTTLTPCHFSGTTVHQGAFQQLLGVHQLHLEASVQPLMTRQGGVECALFLELRRGNGWMVFE